MNDDIVYALDFDGVICDSAVETGITGWKGAELIWKDITPSWPADNYIDQFRNVRPVIETGYEAILAMRLLFEGYPADSILTDFQAQKRRLMKRHQLDSDALKVLFGQIRDQWISENLSEWVAMNPLFEGVADKLAELTVGCWYIVTTKQERFVGHILQANHIELQPDHIFGLDRNMSKENVLKGLQQVHPGQQIHFVEDRLQTLIRFLNTPELGDIRLFFAEWGYNTREDKAEAGRLPVSCIWLDDFLIG